MSIIDSKRPLHEILIYLDQLKDYAGPTPPAGTGPHRYAILAIRQGREEIRDLGSYRGDRGKYGTSSDQ